MKNVKNNSLIVLSFCLALFFTACNKGGKTGLLVPNDATFVLHVDFNSLSSKLTWAEIKQTSWFADALSQTEDSLGKKLLADPETSGIDPKGNLVFFVKQNGGKSYVAFEGNIKDVAKFSKTVEEGGKGDLKIQKDGAYNFVTSSENKNGVLYFNDKQFIAIADASGFNNELQKGLGNRSGSEKYPVDSLKVIAKNTFELKGKDLLDNDERFADLIKDKADMHFWLNGKLYSNMPMGMMSMMKISTLLEDAITSGKADFDNGKIVIDTKNYYGKELTDFLKKNNGGKIDDATISHLPDSEVLAAFAMNYAPEYLRDFVKLLGLDGIANAGLAQLGINLDDIIKANGGSQVFALTDIAMNRRQATINGVGGIENFTYEKEEPKFDFVFGSSVGDKNSFQKLIDAFKKTMDQQMPVKDSAIDRIQNTLTDKWFAVGAPQTSVDAFVAGGKKPAYAQAFKGHGLGGYVNLQKILTTSIANSKDTAYNRNLEISAGFWKTITMYSDIKNGEAISKVEVNLADGSTNALKQLNQYIDKMYQAKPKNDFTTIDDEVVADTAIFLPPAGDVPNAIEVAPAPPARGR